MLIHVSVALPSSANPKLPPGLARISHDEVVLLELQGSLDIESNHPRERDGKFVGKLKIDDSSSKPTLLIGHHLLEGKIQALPKPLAVMHRSPRRSQSKERRSLSKSGAFGDADEGEEDREDGDERMSVDSDDGTSTQNAPHNPLSSDAMRTDSDVGEANNSGTMDESDLAPDWAIIAIVKKKIIFSKRPMPVTLK